MKKKLIYSLLAACMMFTGTSCRDFLEVSSPSVVDAGFVYSELTNAETAMVGLREQWRSCTASHTFANGAFYALDGPGSDLERHPEPTTSQIERHLPEGFWKNGTATSASTPSIDFNTYKNVYTALYSVIALANNAITAIENRADYNEMVASKTQSMWGFYYGQAVALRAASYHDLIRYYGDVPYLTYGGANFESLTPRDVIYEGEIEKLKLVEPLMYRPGDKDENGAVVGKGVPTRTFVQGLIGRMCVFAGGYSTRRNDIAYTDSEGNALSFDKIGSDNNNAFYGRRTDYRKFFETAKTYLDAAVATPGSSVKFHITDPRLAESTGRAFGNPYQYFFQQMINNAPTEAYADESIYEIPMTRGSSNERPYSSGRVSSGGNNDHPTKNYGQVRMQPVYYYDWFDNNDMRRDVTITATGSTGKGEEKLIPWGQGNVANAGGLCLNKWDDNRDPAPHIIKARQSGINGPFMRISDIMLLDAEVNAVLGNDGVAKSLLKQVRERAFATAALAKTDEFITKSGSLYNAIIKERSFEFGGEGDRRYTLIRTGLVAEAIPAARAANVAMIEGLKANGTYTFPNTGNTVSKYIWTALGDLKSSKGYRLTTQCTNADDPFLFPGWRGQHDSWESTGGNALGANAKEGKTNLAIRGLFQPHTPNTVEITYADGNKETKTGLTLKEMMDLMDEGKAKSIVDKDDALNLALTNFAVDILKSTVATDYTTTFFEGYDGTKAPIYFYPINYNTLYSSKGMITNGYGFLQIVP
ncbi:RagB/SusD family nutrient uptake outer membrane protein [Bacteroides sp. 214]|uniref:RagB/SusD family nutrient uptake outer membrane protein n=1 Tax=Bacteroides sp. 214 TaxID=2302935 RepID=UPI0013D8221B|nr:RagB/SusD family nutrient uptake outer membrane protein [Bacteroides sp. 214]NDW12896.1 RagB/SusD family nutrient uptake outer membrane protein [Bacteroides sp. 214]